MAKILLVEDDPVIGKTVVFNLEADGYQVQWAQSLSEAQKINSTDKFDCVILDLGLPDGDGSSFCEQLREAGSRLPIIVLTAQIEEEAAVRCFEIGADDYIRKPFGNREFLARIKRQLNRPVIRDAQLRFASLLILIDKRQAFIQDQELDLKRREFDVLSFLVKNAETVVSRENIMDALDFPSDATDRTVDSQLSHIRTKLKSFSSLDFKISTVYGLGYKIEKK